MLQIKQQFQNKKVEMEIVKYEQKGDYLVVLMRNETKVNLHCFGENGITTNIFYGVDIPNDKIH